MPIEFFQLTVCHEDNDERIPRCRKRRRSKQADPCSFPTNEPKYAKARSSSRWDDWHSRAKICSTCELATIRDDRISLGSSTRQTSSDPERILVAGHSKTRYLPWYPRRRIYAVQESTIVSIPCTVPSRCSAPSPPDCPPPFQSDSASEFEILQKIHCKHWVGVCEFAKLNS